MRILLWYCDLSHGFLLGRSAGAKGGQEIAANLIAVFVSQWLDKIHWRPGVQLLWSSPSVSIFFLFQNFPISLSDFWIIFLHQLTHNITTDFSLNYKFNTWKFLAQNMGRTCCVQKLFLTFRTISVHNIFSPCSAKIRASDKNLPVRPKQICLPHLAQIF